MKKVIRSLLIILLIFIYIYVCKINNIPNETIIFQGEKLDFGNFFGLSLDLEDNQEKLIDVSSDLNETVSSKNTEITAKVKLFDLFTIKDVNVSVIKKMSVVPVGQVGGLKLYTNGVLIVGLGEVVNENNEKIKPYETTGLKEGDTIIKVNEKNLIDTEDLLNLIKNSNGEVLNITYLRDGKEEKCSITPSKTGEKEYKIGLWVRDSAAGIGTLTFYNPETKTFAALGHGITDIDTGDLIDISNGEFITTKILSIIKGVKGKPGRIQGTIENQKDIGKIYKNSKLGIYGKIDNFGDLNIKDFKEYEVADRNDIELGKAKIICSLDSESPKEYEIEIEKIYLKNNDNNKSMQIKVKDEELLNKTGGIIQGMSGCPIIQNDKFIGCVTNVMIDNPAIGYAVFSDLMIKEAQEIEK